MHSIEIDDATYETVRFFAETYEKPPSEIVGRLVAAAKEDFEQLKRDIQEGLDSADRGELLTADEVFQRLRYRHAQTEAA